MARNSGDKNWNSLFGKIYSIRTSLYLNGTAQPSSGTRRMDAPIINKPFSFSRSGSYTGSYGTRSNRANGSLGRYWLSSLGGLLYGVTIRFSNELLYLYNNAKEDGLSVRCVAKFATDSICPKGWEMARYEGDGSWNYVLIVIYSIFTNNGSLPNTSAIRSIKPQPLSFVSSGRYDSAAGRSSRTSGTFAWEARLTAKAKAANLYFSGSYSITKGSDAFGFGMSVRRVAKIGDATDSICPKGWEMARFDGNGSLTNLIRAIYSKVARNAVSSSRADSGLLTSPVSLVRAGLLSYTKSDIRYTGETGYYHLPRLTSSGNSRIFSHGPGSLRYDYNYTRGFGKSVCWGGKFWSNCGVVGKGRVWYNMGRWKCVRVV